MSSFTPTCFWVQYGPGSTPEGEFYPVCEGSPSGHCLGNRGDCDSWGYCECPAGRLLCEENINVCEHEYDACVAYARGPDDFQKGGLPLAMPCDGLVASRAYAERSCCSNEAALRAEAGALGFDFETEGGTPSSEKPLCGLYAAAMSSLVCDRYLAQYVQNSALRVCLSSCQKLFDECGLPGVNFPSWANYTDPASLCQEAWGGFTTQSLCEERPDDFACISGIQSIEVVESAKAGDCVDIIFPTQDEIDYHLNPSVALMDTLKCPTFEDDLGTFEDDWGFPWFFLLFAAIIIPLNVFARMKGYGRQNSCFIGARGGNMAEERNDNTEKRNTTPNESQAGAGLSLPVANAEPAIVPPRTPPAQSANDALAPVPPPTASIPASKGGGPADSNAGGENDVQALTFNQQMDLQSLETKLRMEMVTKEEFEQKKKEIYSSCEQSNM